MLQIELDRADVDPKTGGNLIMGQLFNMSGKEYLPPAGRQFHQDSIQLFKFEPGTGDHGRIRAFIGNVGDGGDFGRTEKMRLAPAPVFCNIDGGAKDIVGGAVNGHGLGNAIDAQKRLVQGFPGQVRGAQTPRQTLRQAFIVGRQGLTQRFAI